MEKKTEDPLVVELKRNLSQQQQALFDTETLGKFLHANNNSLEETLKNLKDFVAWHDELDQDNILTPEEIRELKQFYPHGISGVDRQGRPVLVEQIGRCRLAQLFKLMEDSRLSSYLVQRMEHLRKEVLPHVQKVHYEETQREIVVVVDLKGQIMKMTSKRVYNLLNQVIAQFQRYYPETLHQLYFVNTPMLFETVWAFLKESVRPGTIQKIQFLGSEFEEQLLKLVSKDNLPESLGGTVSDEDLVLHDRGPWVKEQDNSSHSDSDQEIDMSAFKDLKAALSNVLPTAQQVPRREAQTPLNTESDEKN